MRLKADSLIALLAVCGLTFCGPAHADGEDSYPHITQLETYILGQTHVGDPLPDRIARMEQKAFGTASADPDLSGRTDALDDYADKKLGKRTPVAPEGDADVESSAAPGTMPRSASRNDDTDDAGAPAAYPHIDTLEKEILAQTYSKDPLPDRIARMEQKAFGTASTDPDLTNRTDALDEYAQKKLHAKSFDKQQAEQAQREGYMPAAGGGSSAGAGGGRGKQVLNFLGSQLLGMAVPIPGLANTLIGGRAIPASALPQQQSAEVPQRPAEDPAVFEPTPPPSNARMITQVGWCEMQTFGHTSPQLHLGDRLDQLNAELNYAPHQRGQELMDDVPKLLQIVQAKLAQKAH